MKKILLLLIVSLLMSKDIDAQNPLKGKYRRFSIDVSGGIPVINGDIKNKFAGYDLAARLNWNLTSAFSIGTEIGYGALKGYESEKEYFTNRYSKILIGGEVYFFDLLKFNQLSKWFQPYLGVNVGAIKSDIEKSQSDLHFNDWTWANQFNGGLKFKLTNMLDLNASANLMITGTDLLDNFNPQVNNNKSRDVLSSYKLGLTFHLGKKENKSIIWKNDNELMVDDKDDSLNLYTQQRMFDLERKVLALEKQNNEINKLVISSKNDVVNIGEKMEALEKKTLNLDKKILIETTLYFEFSSAEVTSKEKAKLMDVLKHLNGSQNAKVLVSGYADKVGNEEFNLNLSLKRAEKVRDELIKLGVNSNQIEIFGFGEIQYLPYSDKGNRRVIVTVE